MMLIACMGLYSLSTVSYFYSSNKKWTLKQDRVDGWHQISWLQFWFTLKVHLRVQLSAYLSFLSTSSLRSVSKMMMDRSVYDPAFSSLSFSLSVPLGPFRNPQRCCYSPQSAPCLARFASIKASWSYKFVANLTHEAPEPWSHGPQKGRERFGKSVSELALALEVLMPVILRSRKRGHLAKPHPPLRTTEAIVSFWSDGPENGILLNDTKQADRFSATRAQARCPSSTP